MTESEHALLSALNFAAKALEASARGQGGKRGDGGPSSVLYAEADAANGAIRTFYEMQKARTPKFDE